MTDLTKIKIEDLEAEIERRKKYYSIVVHQVEFDLTLEEVKELQEQLNKINPPADPFDVWKRNQEEPTIWCCSKPEAPIWNGSATS